MRVPTAEELEHANARLAAATAEERVAYALSQWKPNILLSTSFGAQSAVLLHMVSRQWPNIPVVLLDTQYLFPETYHFADELTQRLGLNLKVYSSPISREWQEARYGKLWEQGYVSIGDVQTSRPLGEGMSEEDTRFFGLGRECGLHVAK